MIPPDKESIRFYSYSMLALGINVYFAGNQIPMVNLGPAANGWFIWGGDIAPFAGQSGELRLYGGGYLDFIQFSLEPIPEPGTLGLIGLGALCFIWRPINRVRT